MKSRMKISTWLCVLLVIKGVYSGNLIPEFNFIYYKNTINGCGLLWCSGQHPGLPHS